MSTENPRQPDSVDRLFSLTASRRRLLQGSAVALAGAAGIARPGWSPLAGAQEPTSGGTLVYVYDADPEILDPHRTTALLASRVLALLHDNLLSRDYDGTIQPGLADSWEISEDGLTYTFTLKTGVTFHSGKEFTSADVKYTIERWQGLEGSPTAFNIASVETVEAPDPQTVVFTLSEPYNIFLDQLAGAWSVIINQDAVEAAGDQYGVSAVDGTGPFKFVSWERSQRITYERNEAYTWGSPIFQNQGPAYLDAIELRIIPEATTRVAEFQSGNVHIVMSVPPPDVERLSATPGVSIVQYDQLQTTYIGFNQAKTPTDDIAVRNAVNYAINREEVVFGAFFGLGTPAYTMLHPRTSNFWSGAADVQPSYDPDMAAQILEDAGWVAGGDGIREKDGVRLSIPFWIINSSDNILMAQILEQQLAAVGIELETIQYEQTAWFEAARSGEQVAYSIGVFYENADVLYFNFHTRQQPAPNRFSYSVPEVDAWLEASRADPDPEAVTAAYYGVQERLIADAVIAPLLHSLGTVGVTDNVGGVQVHPSRWLYRFLDLYLAD